MSHVLEHQAIRYTWELVRHAYIVDLESEIEIQLVGNSPSAENRPGPAASRTSFFEIEIDQIQKDGRTIYSFRNICPVEISRNRDLQFLNCRVKIGSSRITRRFSSPEGENGTRWLYTDDFFLISLSSSDRHDLGMLLSLILGKLNMIALSIQAGKRVRSEYENQRNYRSAMSTMFSGGVDGAFRDVPVYRQHGEGVGSEPVAGAALPKAASPAFPGAIPADAAGVPGTAAEPRAAVRVQEDITPAAMPPERTVAEPVPPPVPAGQERDLFAAVPLRSPFADAVFNRQAAPPEVAATGSDPVAEAGAAGVPEERDPAQRGLEERIPGEKMPVIPVQATLSCGSCGAGIPGTKKFCGSCGAAVSISPRPGRAPEVSGPTAPAGDEPSPAGSRSAVQPVVNLKSIEELEDLSWLTD